MKKFLSTSFLLVCTLVCFGQDQIIDGNLRIGQNHDALGYGLGLYFQGNTDDFWFKRYNLAQNSSEFRLNITDDLYANDRFVIGTTSSVDGLWYPHFTLLNTGILGLRTDNPTYPLDVNGIIRSTRFPLIVGDDNINDHAVRLAILYDNSMSGSMRYINFGKDATKNNTGELAFNHQSDNSANNWVSLGMYGQERSERLYILGDGNVGIGTIESKGYKLAVNGKIRAQELKIEASNWPDYVFDDSYEFRSLPDLKSFLIKNKHLPEVPSAASVQENGINIGDMSSLLLKKIEELTLHLIEKDEQISDLIKRVKSLESLRVPVK